MNVELKYLINGNIKGSAVYNSVETMPAKIINEIRRLQKHSLLPNVVCGQWFNPILIIIPPCGLNTHEITFTI